jgi:hypothetical protein
LPLSWLLVARSTGAMAKPDRHLERDRGMRVNMSQNCQIPTKKY